MAGTSPVRVMVVWFPDWPIAAAQAAGLLAVGAPVALIDRGLVVACSAEARSEGVRRGQRLREAQQQCPQLVSCAYDPAVDARAFESVIEVIEERIPGVQLLRPGLCAVRARGAARYYGGEEPAAAELLSALDHRQPGSPHARLGIADGFFAAEQAAYRTAGHQRTLIVPVGSSPQFLAPLPIDILASTTPGEASFVSLLKRLGAYTLGDFAALSATDVRSRFGETGALAHARAGGEDPRAVVARILPQDFDQHIEFEPPLEQVETVAFGFRTAAESFVAAITAAGLVCTAIRVLVQSESGAVSEREWAHPRYFTAAEVLDRVRWQLQGSGGGLSSPITGVRVSPERVDAISNHETGLWGAAPDERIHHGLSRIQSMLGHEAVLTAVAGGGRMLAERRVLVPWGDAPPADTKASAGQPWPGSLPDPPPASVFETLLPALVMDERGEAVSVDQRGILSAAPDRVQFARGTHPITAWAGPWPLHQRWWDADRSRRADRFQLVTEGGEAWLLLLEGGRWWAEARYD